MASWLADHAPRSAPPPSSSAADSTTCGRVLSGQLRASVTGAGSGFEGAVLLGLAGQVGQGMGGQGVLEGTRLAPPSGGGREADELGEQSGGDVHGQGGNVLPTRLLGDASARDV